MTDRKPTKLHDLLDVPSQSSQNRGVQLKDFADVFSIAEESGNEYVPIRLIGGVVGTKVHWINSLKKEGDLVSFAKTCLAFNPETLQHDSGVECPYCKAEEYFRERKIIAGAGKRASNPARAGVDFLSNAIIRTIQEDVEARVATAEERNSGFKVKGSKSRTPVRVVRLTAGLVNKIKDVQKLNVHLVKIKDENGDIIKTRKAMNIAHPKFGRDLMIKYNDKASSPSDAYNVQLGSDSPITEDEAEYLTYNLAEWPSQNPAESHETAMKEVARLQGEWWDLARNNVFGMGKKKKARDDEDDDLDPDDDDFDDDVGDNEEDHVPAKRKPAAPAKRKPAPEPEDFDEDDDADDDIPPPKKKPAPAKRKPARDADLDDDEDDDLDLDLDDDEDDVPPPKKKPVAKASAKAKPVYDDEDDDLDDDLDDDDEDDDIPPPKKKPAPAPAKRKPAPPIDDEDDDLDLDDDEDDDIPPPKKKPAPAPAKRKPAPPAYDDEDDDLDLDDDEDDDIPPPKKKPAAAPAKRKPAPPVDDDEDDDEDVFDEPAAKRKPAPAKRKPAPPVDEDDDLDLDDDEDDVPPARTQRTARPAARRR